MPDTDDDVTYPPTGSEIATRWVAGRGHRQQVEPTRPFGNGQASISGLTTSTTAYSAGDQIGAPFAITGMFSPNEQHATSILAALAQLAVYDYDGNLNDPVVWLMALDVATLDLASITPGNNSPFQFSTSVTATIPVPLTVAGTAGTQKVWVPDPAVWPDDPHFGGPAGQTTLQGVIQSVGAPGGFFSSATTSIDVVAIVEQL